MNWKQVQQLRVVNDTKISELLQSRWFKDKYVLVLAQDNLPRWNTQGHGIRQVLTQKADFIFSSNPRDRVWYLGLSDDYTNQGQFISEFNSLKPCIHGSDAHELFFIGHPCAKRGDNNHDCKSDNDDCELRYCWIKADPTFEGLKQVLYEPDERVCIQEANPSPSRHNYTLANIKFNEAFVNNELTVGEVDLPLHRGLIAVTGGRGAGKTAFDDLIANCFINRRTTKDTNSFVRRIYEQTPNLITTLNFIDADEFSKAIDEDSLILETELAYISQGELEEYILENSRLTEQIKELLFSTVKKADR